ncbi:MAG: hypothetical protein Q9160_007646 [Pyrenula sp. 1 TL-2023]
MQSALGENLRMSEDSPIALCSFDPYTQRYGPAAEPRLPPPQVPATPQPVTPNQTQDATDRSPQAKSHGTRSSQSKGTRIEESPQSPSKHSAEESREPRQRATLESASTSSNSSPTPLDIVLRRPAPGLVDETHRPPHLAPSPYVHHFDTYSLVRDLAKGGFTEDQAVTIMKSVRTMLANNLEIAKDGLVSKSDIENETYLFRAACSELRTSLQTSRQAEIQKERSQRNHLQHETDILSQRSSQDVQGLRETLKGMLNDQKLALQEEKRRMDGKIQQLSYEITVLLNSDSKSEVEGLRWILTRRAALALSISAFMCMGALNYNSYRNQKKEQEEQKIAAAKKAVEAREARDVPIQSDKPVARGYEESLG